MNNPDTTLIPSSPDSAVVIKVENLSKIYKLYNTPMDRLKEALHPGRRKYHYDFHALHDVSFEVRKGEMVGIVGKNGSGKSTLLKLITGVLTPSSGSVTVNGRISALLELGAGFNVELTGVENVHFVGTLMGYGREEMDAKLDEILSFADIGEFVHQPVKTYSSGMFVRLAFAVNINVDPEILIIDEALSVGDSYFVQKCMRKIDAFINLGKTILFVSHDQQTLKKYCHKAMLLNAGKIVLSGTPKQIIDIYNAQLFDEKLLEVSALKQSQTVGSLFATEDRKKLTFGNKLAVINSVKLVDAQGKQSLTVMSNEFTSILMDVSFKLSMEDVLFGITIRNKNGIDVYMINTDWKGMKINIADADKHYEISFKQSIALAPGQYSVTPVVSQITSSGICRLDWIADELIFDVISDDKFTGICNLDSDIDINVI